MLIDPRTLTVGERLEIARRRAGMTQREMADLLGWTRSAYIRAEHGFRDDVPAPAVKYLTPGEECRIVRRREGLTLREAEEISGFKSKWIHRAELGETSNVQPLLSFWIRYCRGGKRGG